MKYVQRVTIKPADAQAVIDADPLKSQTGFAANAGVTLHNKIKEIIRNKQLCEFENFLKLQTTVYPSELAPSTANVTNMFQAVAGISF